MGPAKRYSKKREAILEVIRSTDIHPSADWVYQQIKPRYPDLSLGTVYRNLTAFRQEGIISSIGVVNGQERFDGEVRAHTHFICQACGKVEDFHSLSMDVDLSDRAAEEYGVRVDRCRLAFEGVCKDCLKAEKKSLA